MQIELIVTNVIAALTILVVVFILVYFIKRNPPSKVATGSGIFLVFFCTLLIAAMSYAIMINNDKSNKEIIYLYLLICGFVEVLAWLYMSVGFYLTKDKERSFFAVHCSVAFINSLIIAYFLIFKEITFITLCIVNLSILLKLIVILVGINKYRMFDISRRALFHQKDFTEEAFLFFNIQGIAIGYNATFKNLYKEIKLYKTTLKDFVINHPEFVNIDIETSKEYCVEIKCKQKHFFAELSKIYYINEKSKPERAEASEKQYNDKNIFLGTLITIKDITNYKEYNQKMKTTADEAISLAEANEISFLQAQIKPHFLYNTLNTISSLILAEPDAAKELTADLSDFLRSSFFFDNSKELIHIKEELETIEAFARIEKARYGDRLNFEIINKQRLDVLIPRLVIQPLVENAIKHGIQKKEAGGSVILKISQMGEEILVEVTDDGVGIAQECVSGLLLRNDKEHGIGLSNIDKRLYNYYGKGLIIKSQIGKGTSVSFCIPKTNRE